MSVPQTAVFVAALLLTVGGLVLVLKREFGSRDDRRLVGPVRDMVEVVLPPLGVIGLLWWTWATVA